MAERTRGQGECLCGKVKWQATGPYRFFGFCQCSRCRKVSGSPLATVLLVEPGQFAFLAGEDNTDLYLLPEAKGFGNAFCKTCGSRTPRKLNGPGLILMPAGSMADDPGIQPTLVCAEDHTEWFSNLEAALVRP